MPPFSINAFWVESVCGAGTVVGGGACGAPLGAPLGTTGVGTGTFGAALPKLPGATGVMGVAGVGTSGSAGASVAGVAPGLAVLAFFCGAD